MKPLLLKNLHCVSVILKWSEQTENNQVKWFGVGGFYFLFTVRLVHTSITATTMTTTRVSIVIDSIVHIGLNKVRLIWLFFCVHATVIVVDVPRLMQRILGQMKFECVCKVKTDNNTKIAKAMKSQCTKLVRISTYFKCNWEKPGAILLNSKNLLCVFEKSFVRFERESYLVSKEDVEWDEESKNQYLLLQPNNAIICTFSYLTMLIRARARAHAPTYQNNAKHLSPFNCVFVSLALYMWFLSFYFIYFRLCPHSNPKITCKRSSCLGENDNHKPIIPKAPNRFTSKTVHILPVYLTFDLMQIISSIFSNDDNSWKFIFLHFLFAKWTAYDKFKWNSTFLLFKSCEWS